MTAMVSRFPSQAPGPACPSEWHGKGSRALGPGPGEEAGLSGSAGGGLLPFSPIRKESPRVPRSVGFTVGVCSLSCREGAFPGGRQGFVTNDVQLLQNLRCSPALPGVLGDAGHDRMPGAAGCGRGGVQGRGREAGTWRGRHHCEGRGQAAWMAGLWWASGPGRADGPGPCATQLCPGAPSSPRRRHAPRGWPCSLSSPALRQMSLSS